MAQPALVVAAIIVDDVSRPSRVLAARRSTPEALAGRWEFPGGKVEPGEGAVEALRRELWEELQVQVIVGDELVAPDPAGWPISERYVMRAWLAQISAGTPAPTGSHDRIVWLEPSRLLTLDWLDADVAIAQAVRHRLAADRGNPFPEQNGT
ncbi:MAG: NUDIX domain-containing protein [Propionibacteriaceae bacterium]